MTGKAISALRRRNTMTADPMHRLGTLPQLDS